MAGEAGRLEVCVMRRRCMSAKICVGRVWRGVLQAPQCVRERVERAVMHLAAIGQAQVPAAKGQPLQPAPHLCQKTPMPQVGACTAAHEAASALQESAGRCGQHALT